MTHSNQEKINRGGEENHRHLKDTPLCAEGSLQSFPPHLSADLEYIKVRNLLIPEAKKYASEKVDGKKYPYKWNLTFFNRMDELAITKGLLPARGKNHGCGDVVS